MQEELISKLQKDIDVVSKEISDLLHVDDVFQNRVKTQVKVVDTYVVGTLSRSYYSYVLTSVRRQVGANVSEISLLNILNKLMNNNTLITEDWYVAAWLKDSDISSSAVDTILEEFIRNIPHSEFKEHFGVLDKSIVEGDIEYLKDATKDIKLYVDRRIAHTDKKESIIVGKEECTTALNALERLTSKYILLLKQKCIALKPVMQ